nr:transposase [uncultured Oscillibacter sp.]
MEEKVREPYPSDLTDEQWEEIAPLYTGMRSCTWSKRELTDAVLYLVDSGCKWRQLPHDFPPYSTVHSFYRRARIRPCLKIGGMPNGERFYRQSRQIFAGGLTPGKKI